MSAPLDFSTFARRLLEQADKLLPQWLPGGRRIGVEWKCGNLAGELGDSCSVNMRTGLWADFASGEKGGDLLSLYAAIEGVKPGEAAKRLIEQLRLGGIEAPDSSTRPRKSAPERARKTPWVPIVPVPDSAGPTPLAHPRRGRPERSWTYRDRDGAVLGLVHRFRTSDGGKEILPIVWARNADTGKEEWHWMQWTAPRPLYGLDRLRDGFRVLIVEGEKCADAAHEALQADFDVLTWSGGGKAVDKADWTVLAGRQVMVWPDCDSKCYPEKHDLAGQLMPEDKQPGIMAAESVAKCLGGVATEVFIVRIPAPGIRTDGWDVADAISEGYDRAQLVHVINQVRIPAHATVSMSQKPVPAQRLSVIEGSAGQGGEPPDDDDWQRTLLRRKGELVACVSNIVIIVTQDPKWRGVIGYDEFSSRTVKLKPLPTGAGIAAANEESVDWTDIDTTYVVVWLTRVYGMTPAKQVVDESIELVSRLTPYHPVRSYLRSLRWDENERLNCWLEDFFGVHKTEYSMRVARWFLLGMVARVMEPGVKFDYCLVLEGAQGRMKSAALRALGSPWFSDTELDLGNKDALSAIQGKWLHEFAEMGSVARAEARQQKSFLSRQVDEFRPHYGRRQVRIPRQVVFAGTTNEWQWNKDPTGGRRFWPVEIAGDVDVNGLASIRDQLFAEALLRYESGERFWPTPDEQRQFFDPVQLQREAEDAFGEIIHDWLEGRQSEEFSIRDVCADALKLDPGRMTRDVMTRVGMQLKRMGCSRIERRNGTIRFVYVLPAWTSYQKARAAKRQSDARDRDGSMPF